MQAIGRGYVDLYHGIFARKAMGVETNKRQLTIPLPPRLPAHMRRWHRLGAHAPEYRDHLISALYPRSGKNPHQVSDYCGVSMQIINKHYLRFESVAAHHFPGVRPTALIIRVKTAPIFLCRSVLWGPRC